MTAYVSNKAGNWNDPTVWTPSGTPGNTDTAVIGHAVTLNVDATCGNGSDPGVCVGDSVNSRTGSLTLSSGVTLTMNGTLRVGAATAAAGTLTFGAGSTIAMGSSNLQLNNCTLRSNATSGNWAEITGTGGIASSGALANSKQDVSLSYLSIQLTGNLDFDVATAGGGVSTNQFRMTHCAVVGCGTIAVGTGGWTPNTTPFTLDYCDFRDTGNFLFGTTSGGSVDYWIKNSTFFRAAASLSEIYTYRVGCKFYDCVFSNYQCPGTSSANAGHDIQDCLYIPTNGVTSGANLVVMSEQYAAGKFLRSYLYLEYPNPHPFSNNSIGGGSGTAEFGANVIEAVYNTDGANIWATPKLDRNCHENLFIGELNGLGYIAGANATTVTFDLKRNTIFIKGAHTLNGVNWYSEGYSWAGTIKLRSGIIAGSPYANLAYSTIGGQTIAFAGYNAVTGCTFSTRYHTSVTVTDGSATDLPTYPYFVDPSRCLTAYDLKRGGPGTAANARTEFAAVNGYSDTTKTQSDASSGYSVRELVAWVRAGFRPQNAALRHRGDPTDGRPDVGAMPVRTMTRRNLRWRSREMNTYGCRR